MAPATNSSSRNGNTKSIRAGMNGYDTQRVTPTKPTNAAGAAIQTSSGRRLAPESASAPTSGNTTPPNTRTVSGKASPMANDMAQYASFTGISNSSVPVIM